MRHISCGGAAHSTPEMLTVQLFRLAGSRCYDFAVSLQLSEVEVRVLGVLVEKEITTPEYYPLSLNALVNACNQKSNREPVMTLDEETVRAAIRSLSEQALVRSAGGESRVAKFEHRLSEAYNFHRHEIAVLCVLLLRGPQTPGELRTRSERMYAFEDLEGVHSALNHLMRREPPLVRVLPRQPGTKEARYVHLLGDEATAAVAGSGGQDDPTTKGLEIAPSADGERIARLEEEASALRRELEELREQFAAFRKQFQ